MADCPGYSYHYTVLAYSYFSVLFLLQHLFPSIRSSVRFYYPVFGLCLIIMAVGVIIGIYTNPEFTIPEIWSHMTVCIRHEQPIWSFMFITVACGAISGFHSTQSPLMARCMKSEATGSLLYFYGAMVAEGIIALILGSSRMCSL